jgi:hypothetical protein
MADSFAIDVKRGRRDLKFSINSKGGVCWQGLQFAQFAHDLFFSLMSNFKMPKGEFVGQFSQTPWISLHRHNLNFIDHQFTLGVSILGFQKFLFWDFFMVSKKSNITKSRMSKY